MTHRKLPVYLLLGLLALSSQTSAADYGTFGPSEFSKDRKEVVLIPWDSEVGKKLFERAEYKQDFFQRINRRLIRSIAVSQARSWFSMPCDCIKNNAPNQPELEVQAPKAFGGSTLPSRYHQRVCKKVKAMYPFSSNQQRTGWQAREERSTPP
ncbi:MAG: hypothetical protein ACREU8_07270 [Gammaproteobacteria bacterium]